MAQFPATSHTVALGVEALLVSVPDGTLVESVKVGWLPAAKPEVASAALQAMETSDGLQLVGAAPHESVGAVASSLIGTLDEEVSPAPFVAEQVSVVPPVSPARVVAPQP